ncbi:MFS transporter [Cystobacter fuscus]
MNAEAPREVRFWPFMFALFLGSFITVLSSSSITIAIPEMQRHFDAELSLMQWTLTGFMLAMGTVAPLTGYLGDRFSFKWLYRPRCGASW